MTAVGGGAADPVPLTADMIARVIIAAARAYGDDPVTACTSALRMHRRSLTAAASGIALGADVPVLRIANILGVRKQSVIVARAPSQRNDGFTRAERAAMRAAEYATWEPEAAESVVGEDLPEVTGAPPGDAIEPDRPLRIPAAFDEPMLPAPRAAPDSMARAPVDFRASKGLAAAERPVEDLVLEALASGMALSSMSLASVIGRKEMAVSTALASLQARGQVVAEPVEAGPRKLAWRVAA